MNLKNLSRGAAALTALLVLAACDNANVRPEAAPADPEQHVGERAQQRATAMVDGRFSEAYAYYTPGYRSSTHQEDFVVRHRVAQVRWSGANLVDVECEEALCTVALDIEYFIDEPLRGVSEFRSVRRIDETWVKIAEEWYFVDES